MYSCCYATIVRWAGYIRPVSGQQLSKHVPAATVMHATGKWSVVYVVHAEGL
jgi:hypothetical protein